MLTLFCDIYISATYCTIKYKLYSNWANSHLGTMDSPESCLGNSEISAMHRVCEWAVS